MQETKHRRDDAANYIRTSWGIPCSSGHLANLASRKLGPKFFRVGRFPLYPQSELDVWAQSLISLSNAETELLAPTQPPLKQCL